MANALEDAQSWLADQQVTKLTETITYTRGANSVSLSACVVRRWKKGDDEFCDWGIRRADLKLAGSAALPQTGEGTATDTITHGSEVWDVADPLNEEDDDSPYQYADAFKFLLIVHTQREV